MDAVAVQSVFTRYEHCGASAVRRVAAMLDLPAEGLVDGAPLPKGWHFILLGADTPRSVLRADGFPGLGVPLPDLGLPRLLQGGRRVVYHQDIPVGSTVVRTSAVADVTEKMGPSGRKAVVKVAHSLRLADRSQPAITETQTYFLLPAQTGQKQPVTAQTTAPESVAASRTKSVMPDETMLFQFSALGFNSHKIHIDKNYARDVEGFPDLVVNGGLTTLFLTEFARRELALDLNFFTMKNVAPLFCGHRITLAADRVGAQWSLKAFDDSGRVAAEMEAGNNEL
ncbi:MaoC family dehydratase N-terminal domain-containing protein [Pandoraea sp. XJJ-1]|uniref:FAS1-like dehydratase domain-containing protein n=1 Tax=Pandoraea sp. XJJ-1 TaxID=3002643 RepID=UPI00227E87E0|nr:MaoC family dehydratase N-terminal domain-containing protein [Pandoraea sp. XJJ-1]WAL84006.1 MaoC family dehydratase N-terminal domain-containing protein [Pandoraea sp. XJJ-1]